MILSTWERTGRPNVSLTKVQNAKNFNTKGRDQPEQQKKNTGVWFKQRTELEEIQKSSYTEEDIVFLLL